MNFKMNQGKTLTEKRKGAAALKSGSRFNDLFDECWEVFVVKLDKETGKLVGKTACCALEPV